MSWRKFKKDAGPFLLGGAFLFGTAGMMYAAIYRTDLLTILTAAAIVIVTIGIIRR